MSLLYITEELLLHSQGKMDLALKILAQISLNIFILMTCLMDCISFGTHVRVSVFCIFLQAMRTDEDRSLYSWLVSEKNHPPSFGITDWT